MLLSAECEPIVEFIKKQKDLITIERDEEEAQLRELLRDTKVRELTQFGLCLSKLRIKSTKVGAFDKPVIVFRPNAYNPSKASEDQGDSQALAALKFTNNQKFSRGDLVNLYSMDKSKEFFSDKPLAVGSLEKLEDFKLTVVFGESTNSDFDFFTEEAQEGMYCLVQAVNDITYRRFGECLNRLEYYIKHPDCPHYNLIRTLFDLHPAVDPKKPEEESIKVSDFYDKSLNKYQQLAVERALNADFYSLIHGPPGTGKTKTVCEVIQQFCARKKKILVTAASNIAVDNIIERLEVLKTGFKIIRVGNPTRTLE